MPAADETAGWDDVAAISRSWDRVVDDYKIFHAVRARGGTVDDLPALSPQETQPEGLAETAAGSSSHADDKGEEEHREASSSAGNEHEQAAADETPAADEPGAEYTAANPSLLPPQAVLKDADENMKKLLMSWYYAGYYTGLYEGQQQAQQAQQAQPTQQTPQTPQTQPPTAAETVESVHGDGPGKK